MLEREPVALDSIQLDLWHPHHEALGAFLEPGGEQEANQALRALSLRVPLGALWRVHVKAVTADGDEHEMLLTVSGTPSRRGLRSQIIRLLEGCADEAVLQRQYCTAAGDVAAMIRSLTGTPDQVSRGEALADHLTDEPACGLHGPCQEGRAEYNAELLLRLRLGYTPQQAIDFARHQSEEGLTAWSTVDQQLRMGIRAAWRDAHDFLDQFQDVNA